MERESDKLWESAEGTWWELMVDKGYFISFCLGRLASVPSLFPEIRLIVFFLIQERGTASQIYGLLLGR